MPTPVVVVVIVVVVVVIVVVVEDRHGHGGYSPGEHRNPHWLLIFLTVCFPLHLLVTY